MVLKSWGNYDREDWSRLSVWSVALMVAVTVAALAFIYYAVAL